MKLVWLSPWALVALSCMTTGQGTHSESDHTGERCAKVNAGYDLRSSIICERKDVYDFLIAGDRFTFEKRWYQEHLRIRIGHWLLDQGIPLEQIKDSVVEGWVGTHVFAPEVPLMRVQVLAQGGNVLIELPFHPSRWQESITAVEILGKGRYPDHMGIRGGTLVVELGPGVAARDVKGVIDRVPGLDVPRGAESASVFYLQTPLLKEAWARSNLLRAGIDDPRIRQVLFAPAGDIAGEFVKAWEFPLVPKKSS